MSEELIKSAKTALSRLERYSDLKLLCRGREFKVHKAIVCLQSPVIAAACDRGFEGSFTNIIEIQEFDVMTVSKLIRFMYEGRYDFEDIIDDAKFQPLLNEVYVYSIADYYQVEKLKKQAKDKVANLVNQEISLLEFPNAVDFVHRKTQNKKLRNLVISVAEKSFTGCFDLQKYLDAESMAGFKAEKFTSEGLLTCKRCSKRVAQAHFWPEGCGLPCNTCGRDSDS